MFGKRDRREATMRKRRQKAGLPANASYSPDLLRPAFGLISLTLILFFAQSGRGQCFWRARPLPDCRSFWFVESGPRLGTREAFAGFGHVLALGYMRNRQPDYALGVGIEFSTGSQSGLYRLAVMPRYRHWFSPDWAGDAIFGLAILGEGDPPVGYKGLSAGVALNYRNLIALNAGVETRRLGYTTQHSFSMGLRFGSYLAIAEMSVVIVLIILLARGIGASP